MYMSQKNNSDSELNTSPLKKNSSFFESSAFRSSGRLIF